MYLLTVEKIISTAHQLRNYEGPCARTHGHNWKIQIEVQSKTVNKTGIAIDFSELDKLLWNVIGPFDHQLLNSVTPFNEINPTAENIAKYIFEQIKSLIPPGISLQRVNLWETDNYMVSYEE